LYSNNCIQNGLPRDPQAPQLELQAIASAISAMTAKPAFDQPSKTLAIDGEVVVDGPDGVGHSFTPAAARETGARLAIAADQAEAQSPAAGKSAPDEPLTDDMAP
jgi:hypothetical protein